MNTPPFVILASVVSFGILSAVSTGLVVVAGPVARIHRLDEQRVRDLQVITDTIHSYYGSHGSLPESLGMLWQSAGSEFLRLRDPATDAPYGYATTTSTGYELCASFATSLDGRNGGLARLSVSWDHNAGRQCFDFDLAKKRR